MPTSKKKKTTKKSAKKTAKKSTKKVAKKAAKKTTKKAAKKTAKKVTKKTPAKKATKKVDTTATLEGKKMPSFKAEVTPQGGIKAGDFKGKTTILFFYPKDNTPGCTQEGKDFKDNFKKFQAQGAQIFGVSKDSLASHLKFQGKFNFPFELISDEDESTCQAFGVMKMKNMYGKKFIGIERSTFLIDKSGKVIKEWRKVKVNGHVEEVLQAVKDLA